tara:strand:+ start:418 stop:1560 length:1143 start_codon:yes stop_codon:yes gene_type:complete
MKKINDKFSCRGLFFIVGFYIGLWTIRIPTIKDQISTDYLGIGYIFLFFAIGSIITMIFANDIIKKFSSKTTILYSGVIQGLLWLAMPFINNLQIFMPLAFIFGWCFGVFEVAINYQASEIEKKEKKSMMSAFHGFFSLGLLIGAFLTSLFLQWRIDFFINTLIYVVVLVPLTYIYALSLEEDEKSLEKNKRNIFFIWPIIIFLLVFLSIANALTEGGVDAWGALYMRDVVNVDGFKIGIATICFNIFMVIGRFTGDKLRDKLGVFLFLIILILLSLFGLIILYSFDSLLSSIIGFSTLGMGASSIVPIAYSLAGKVQGIDTAVGITIISIAVYGVFMIAPVALGFLANSYGVNYVYLPMIIIFIINLITIIIFKKKFNL